MIRQVMFDLVGDLKKVGHSQREALEMAGVSRGTWQYRDKPRRIQREPIPQADRGYPSRISTQDEEQVMARITAAWAKGESVQQAFATSWDEGVYLGSRRQWYRIANRIEDQQARPKIPTKRRGSKRSAPIVEAHAAGEVWVWDISDVKGAFVGCVFKAYSVQDLYSRKIVAHRVASRQSDVIARDMMREAFNTHGAPKVLHSDNGAAMKSERMRRLCGDHDVAMSFNRPSVSNDNPFKESEFRTMKYRPSYPGMFEDLPAAQQWVGEYVDWFNNAHHHSSLALHTPRSVYDGTWRQIQDRRVQTLDTYYAHHHDRFRKPPIAQEPPSVVGINLHHKPEVPDNQSAAS